MDIDEVTAALDRAEEAVSRGEGLSGTGFWKAVGAVKRQPELADQLGARIATIDRAAFEDWAFLTVPVSVGTGLALLATATGLGAIGACYFLDEPFNWVVFGAGTAVLLVSTHGLGHLVVGKAQGMRFTHWFVGDLKRPQPGVKVDYATYLTTPARQRAWMHAAGALVTKVVPFALIPAAMAADLPSWVVWATLALGIAQVATDALWSVKASDWKKFRREMRYD